MSELRADTITGSDGTSPVTLTKQSAAKAWINFNGTGTVATRDSFNISSITDGGTSDYTTTVTSAFNNNDYSIVGNCCPDYGVAWTANIQIMHDGGSAEQDNSTIAQRFRIVSLTPTGYDAKYVTHNLHGDLA